MATFGSTAEAANAYKNYNAGTNYQALINQAVAAGDMTSAAIYEQQRNAKIQGEGKTQAMTNNYVSYLPSSGGGDGGFGAASGGYSYQKTPVVDLSGYIRDQYAENLKAEKDSLTSTYEQNLAKLQKSEAGLSDTYNAARNSAAAQNELARKQWNEQAAALGVNTGATGQAALAQRVTLQNELNDITTSEAAARAENQLQQDTLAIAYRNAIAEAEAEGNSAMAMALYQEYVRQYDANAQQDALAAQYAAQAAADQRSSAQQIAMTMIQSGIMPDSATLGAAGINSMDAALMVSRVNEETYAAQYAAQQAAAQAATPAAKPTGTPTPAPVSTGGSLSPTQVDAVGMGYGPVSASNANGIVISSVGGSPGQNATGANAYANAMQRDRNTFAQFLNR